MSTSEQTTSSTPANAGTTNNCRCKPLNNPVWAERRRHNAKVAATAMDIDKGLNASINEAAENLNIPREELATHFALKSTFGEKRPPTVFNGLVIEKSKEWANDYSGPGRGFMPYVAQRIKGEGLVAKVTKAGQSEKYTKIAAESRLNKKSVDGISHTRAAAIKSAQTSLANINKELMVIHKQTGIEYMLCVSRGKATDQMDPHYYASDKTIQFVEGNINVPVTDFLRLLDMWVVGGIGGLKAPLQGKKDLYRKSVRSLLNASYCQALHTLGHDTSGFRHIEYTNYSKLVETLRVVVRGYPLTPDGHLTNPSKFSKGTRGLIHAEKHLKSGDWGFERIQDSVYNEWMKKRHQAAEAKRPPPFPLFVSVPGTSLEEALLAAPTGSAGNVATASKKRTASEDGGQKHTKKSKVTPKSTTAPAAKSKRTKRPKSSETIDSDLDTDLDDDKWEKQALKQLNGESESGSESVSESEPEPEPEDTNGNGTEGGQGVDNWVGEATDVDEGAGSAGGTEQ